MIDFKLKKLPPYDFILEELGNHVTSIKPMFGAFGIYRDEQILMILRKKEKYDNDTGLWLAVSDGSHEAIKKTLPELRDLELFGSSPTSWQVLGEELDNFEEIAFKICELIKNRDHRIGRIPKSKLIKKTDSKNAIATTNRTSKKMNTKSANSKTKRST